MILEIKNLLAAEEMAALRVIAARAKFVDGRLSNIGFNQKANLQIDTHEADHAQSAKIVADAFARSREFGEFTFAKRIAPPLLAKYEPGMKYGAHADAAFLPLPNGLLRSDLSCTVFLSDPASYEGGELVLHLGDRQLPIKANAGNAIIYPSTTLHEVAPVRKGERLVSITFIESRIVGEQERFLLFELGDISSLEGDHMNIANRMRLEAVRQNLTRRWGSN
jgi:PKHD-type hydroxylase